MYIQAVVRVCVRASFSNMIVFKCYTCIIIYTLYMAMHLSYGTCGTLCIVRDRKVSVFSICSYQYVIRRKINRKIK